MTIVLVFCQIWLLILPIIWLLKIEQKAIAIPPPTRFDWITGVVIGLLMFGIILAVYWLLLKQWIDVDVVRANTISPQSCTLLLFRFYFSHPRQDAKG